MSRKSRNEAVKAKSIPPPVPPERPSRPPMPPILPYPAAPLLEEDIRRILREIINRLDSIENRLDRIEKILLGKK